MGKVFLVGAGPGDPGLITVKGRHLLEKADCIVYDRLANPRLLSFAKPGCNMVYVGKAASRHTMKQEEINSLLVRCASEYETVVRLKGGDVYVFGRGGEEGLYLLGHGVKFEVVPGISSSIAGLAYAGIPITHRGTAHGFRVVTAHDKDDKLTDLDFASMARSEETLVFLMGLSKLGEITRRLLEAGMSPQTPAAVISHATLSSQDTVAARLGELEEAVKRHPLSSPALIVVGAVAAMREKLNFLEPLPLFGRRILLPHPGRGASMLAEQFEALGARVTEVCTGEICEIPGALRQDMLEGVKCLAFSSKHGVDAFFRQLFALGLDTRSLSGITVAAVGSGTANQLLQFGVKADLIPQVFHSVALCETLREAGFFGKEVLLVKVRGHLEDCFPALKVRTLEVYENCPVDSEQIRERAGETCFTDMVFSCSSAVQAVAKALGTEAMRSCRCFSIGEKTSETLKRYGIMPVQSEQATLESLAQAVTAGGNE
mgnify:CR=1 FL=1